MFSSYQHRCDRSLQARPGRRKGGGPMTMISDPDMPAIDIGPATHTGEQAVVGKPSTARMIGVVAAGALLITAVNITAAVYFYRGINDLRLVERRLEQLGSF